VRVVRLLVLGTLAMWGPMHGHQMRRTIETIDLEAWSEVRVGSIYHALHQMSAEGLIEPVQTERTGRLPTRTVYRITATGEAELAVLRDRALREVKPPADPFDVALWVATGLPHAAMEQAVSERLETLRRQLADLVAERLEHIDAGDVPAVGLVLMAHGVARLEAEVHWHEELLASLPTLAAESRPERLAMPDSNLTTQI
jgi:DNA-binding PadR family transcriptional regulator